MLSITVNLYELLWERVLDDCQPLLLYPSCDSWLDKLGMCAASGVQTVLRQDFYGGNYALIDYELNPNPVRCTAPSVCYGAR